MILQPKDWYAYIKVQPMDIELWGGRAYMGERGNGKLCTHNTLINFLKQKKKT